MNILILSWRGPKHPHEGGAEIVTHEHAKYWVKNGHQVTLFTSSFDGALPEEDIDGIHIVRRGKQAFGVQIAAFFWYLRYSEEPFNLVIDHFHGIPFFSPLYVRVSKIAFIHEIARNVWLHNPWKGPFHYLPSIIGKFGEPFVFKFFYKNIPFVTVSSSTKADLVKYGIDSDQITVIHNGVITQKVSVSKNKAFTVMFLGALAKDKGVEDAIASFELIAKRIPEAQFWVVGKGTPKYVEILTQMAKRSGIEAQVKFFGFVSEKRKFELLKKAHVLINSSVHEGWGLVNIEANSQGTPVVGYRVSGMVDSVTDGKTGLLVDYGDITALSRAVCELHDNRDLYKSLAKEAQKWSEQYTWDDSCKKSLTFIEKHI